MQSSRHFHRPDFVLFVNNLILKEKIFLTAKMMCSARASKTDSLATKFGTMTSDQLLNAIEAIQMNHSTQYSSPTEHRYLRSIHAACGDLPHTNEASDKARVLHFSWLLRFGPPCLFVTVSPDDLRHYRIVIYSLEETEYKYGNTTVEDFTDDQIYSHFKMRQHARFNHPGLCAIEYD